MQTVTHRWIMFVFLALLAFFAAAPLLSAQGATVVVTELDFEQVFPTTGIPCTDLIGSVVFQISGTVRTVQRPNGGHEIADLNVSAAYTPRGESGPT